MTRRHGFWSIGLVLVLLLAGVPTSGPVSAAGVGAGEYRADVPYPEFMPMWREGWAWTDEEGQRVRYAYDGMPLGGYLYAWFHNGSGQPVEVKDVLLQNVSLAQGIAPEHKPSGQPDDKYVSSLKFSKLPGEQLAELVAAGEPVWWKVEPMVIPPGGFGQITVRLRRDPKVETLAVTVPALPEADGKILLAAGRRQPRFFSINFTPKFDAVYAYLRHPSGQGIAPARILVDNIDVTSACTVVADPSVDTVPVMIRPQSPFKRGSWHLFEAAYADGLTARVGMTAWQPGLVYGMWGYSRVGQTEDENRKFYLEDMRVHHINTLLYSLPGEVRAFLRTREGREYSRKTGIRAMTNWAGDAVDAPFMFLTDEPDAGDFMSTMLDPNKRIGSLGQWLVERANMFRRAEPGTPVLLNVDNTFKPENWYTYAQLADLPCADPYYQEALQSVYKNDPINLGAYLKPTYVYGVGTIYQSAGAPKPMHLILQTCRLDFKEFPFRAPTPEEKRIAIYYAIAAGAKALSYWWYTPFGEFYGCGGSGKDMEALWKEIGLVGAELRSAEPMLIRSCPATVRINGPRFLWVRSLLAGDDALAIVVANDNIACDRAGTTIRPIERARLTVQLPAWLKAGDVFEITHEGTKPVEWRAQESELTLDLGTVSVARFVMVASDRSLRQESQRIYNARCAANVRALLGQAKSE